MIERLFGIGFLIFLVGGSSRFPNELEYIICGIGALMMAVTAIVKRLSNEEEIK